RQKALAPLAERQAADEEPGPVPDAAQDDRHHGDVQPRKLIADDDLARRLVPGDREARQSDEVDEEQPDGVARRPRRGRPRHHDRDATGESATSSSASGRFDPVVPFRLTGAAWSGPSFASIRSSLRHSSRMSAESHSVAAAPSRKMPNAAPEIRY